MGLFEQWNKNRFSIYKNDEKTVLKLIESLSKWFDTTLLKVDEIDNLSTENKNKKVSYDDLHNKYKLDANADFTGSWFGFKNPVASEPGIQMVVEKNTSDITKIFSKLGDIVISIKDFPLLEGEIDDTLRLQRALNSSINKILLIPYNEELTISTVNINTNQTIFLLGKIIAEEQATESMLIGSSINTVIIKGFNKGKIIGNLNNSLTGLTLKDTHNFIIEGLNCENLKNKGISISGASYNGVILNNFVKGSDSTTGGGISIFGSSIKNINVLNNNVTLSRIGIALNGGNNLIVSQNICTDNSSSGIMLDGIVTASGDGTKNSIITNNTITGCTTSSYGAIYLGNGCSDNIVSNNQCNENVSSGIRISGGVGYENKRNKLINNVCSNNSRNGIELSQAPQSEIINNTLNNNVVAGLKGIYILGSKICYNLVENNATDGILVQSGNCLIGFNTVNNNNRGLLTAYGGDTPSGNIIIFNRVENNTSSQITDVGTSTIKDNIGYVSENKGLKMLSGDGVNTTFLIPHGLSKSPTYANVVPNSVTTIGDYFVTWDATNIIVTYKVAPSNTVNGIKFLWEAKI